MLSRLNHGQKVLLAAYLSLAKAEPPSKKELAQFPLHYTEALSHLRRAGGGYAVKIDPRAKALANKSRKIIATTDKPRVSS
ncbi:hypothetical protein [Mycolicibacterium septicum]|uniref:hypothetical protein n=1 Tax=Mycolicibacterium septicum TaxID=98668 RepID=UPI001AFC4B6F|nr:hypothetical protein [Mycolicibacterium septicum]QRY51837.1 hypothetical protein JVX95_31435 [Mycolicibacterium septicum]